MKHGARNASRSLVFDCFVKKTLIVDGLISAARCVDSFMDGCGVTVAVAVAVAETVAEAVA